MNIIEVGKKYNGPIPPQDGLFFEIGPDGDMQLLIQFCSPSKEEKVALTAGFLKYSLYRQDDGLACWVFEYAAPVLFMDAPFHAGLYAAERVKKFLETERNSLSVTILDGEIVQAFRFVGLEWAAMTEFKNIVRGQTTIDRVAYNATIDRLYRQQSKDIFVRGQIFVLKGDNA